MKPEKDQQPKSSTSKKPNGRVFDVSRPGKAAALPTSKPVISGHKPEVQASQAAVSGVGEARPLLTRRKIEISPLGDLKKPESESAEEPKAPEQEPGHAQPTQEETEALATAALDAVTGPPDLVDVEEPKAPAAKPQKLTIVPTEPEKSEQAEKPAEVEKIEEPVQPEESAGPETTKEPEETEVAAEPEAAAEEKPESEAEPQLGEKELPAETSSMPEAEPVEKPEGEEEQAPEPVIEPLFDDSGSIVVSNHESHRSHHGLKVFLLLLLILVLAAIALDIVMDLGLLTLNGIPHTDLLKN